MLRALRDLLGLPGLVTCAAAIVVVMTLLLADAGLSIVKALLVTLVSGLVLASGLDVALARTDRDRMDR